MTKKHTWWYYLRHFLKLIKLVAGLILLIIAILEKLQDL
jgi:hypothetical protein